MKKVIQFWVLEPSGDAQEEVDYRTLCILFSVCRRISLVGSRAKSMHNFVGDCRNFTIMSSGQQCWPCIHWFLKALPKCVLTFVLFCLFFFQPDRWEIVHQDIFKLYFFIISTWASFHVFKGHLYTGIPGDNCRVWFQTTATKQVSQ